MLHIAMKKDAEQPLKAEVVELIMPKKFEPIARDLVQMHGAKKIGYGAEISVNVQKEK